MGVFGFNQFKGATQGETPNFAMAEATQAQLDNTAKARSDSLRSSNMLGAGGLYNKAMGEASPIADMLFGGAEVGVAESAAAELAAAELAAAVPAVIGAGGTAAAVAPVVAEAALPAIAEAGAAGSMGGPVGMGIMALIAALNSGLI